MGAIMVSIFVSLVGIVAAIYYSIQDRKDTKQNSL